MTTNVEIDDDLNDRIRRLAEVRRESPDQLVRGAIAKYADRAEARHGFLQEAEDSWEAFQKNGLPLTGSEVQAWLRSWSADGETAMPECHE